MTDQLEAYQENIKNLIDRAKKVVDIKEKAEQKRFSRIQDLEKAFKSLEEQKCELAIAEMRAQTERGILVPVQIFCSVIENHVYMSSAIIGQFNPDGNTDQARKILDSYSQAAQTIRSQVIPLLQHELEILGRMSTTLSLRELKQYKEAFNKEEKAFTEIYERNHIQLKATLAILKNIRKAKKEIWKYKDNNPKTWALLEFTGATLVMISGFSSIKKGFKIVKMFRDTMEKIEKAEAMINYGKEAMRLAQGVIPHHA